MSSLRVYGEIGLNWVYCGYIVKNPVGMLVSIFWVNYERIFDEWLRYIVSIFWTNLWKKPKGFFKEWLKGVIVTVVLHNFHSTLYFYFAKSNSSHIYWSYLSLIFILTWHYLILSYPLLHNHSPTFFISLPKLWFILWFTWQKAIYLLDGGQSSSTRSKAIVMFRFQRNPDIAGRWRRGAGVGPVVVIGYQ